MFKKTGFRSTAIKTEFTLFSKPYFLNLSKFSMKILSVASHSNPNSQFQLLIFSNNSAGCKPGGVLLLGLYGWLGTTKAGTAAGC